MVQKPTSFKKYFLSFIFNSSSKQTKNTGFDLTKTGERKTLTGNQKLLLSQLVLNNEKLVFGRLFPGVTNKMRQNK